MDRFRKCLRMVALACVVVVAASASAFAQSGSGSSVTITPVVDLSGYGGAFATALGSQISPWLPYLAALVLLSVAYGWYKRMAKTSK